MIPFSGLIIVLIISLMVGAKLDKYEHQLSEISKTLEDIYTELSKED